MTGGMAFEGLNNLGHSGREAIIILNDNGRSYAPTVSKLGESLARLRLNPALRAQPGPPRAARCTTCRSSATSSSGASTARQGRASARCSSRRRSSRRSACATPGPFDGHDIEGSSRRCATPPSSTARSSSTSSPRRAAATPPAEDDDEKHLHDIGVRPDGRPSRATLHRRRSPRRSSRRPRPGPSWSPSPPPCPTPPACCPFQERFPDRFFDVGIAEQHAVTAAAGMAMGGLRPVVAIYSTFLTRAFDQVILRRRPAPPAGRVLPRPGRHHRRRRRRRTTACSTWCCSPRCRA